MALNGGVQVNGTMLLPPAEEKDLYTQLARLRDTVLAGQHPQFKLSPAVVEQLKATLSAVKTTAPVAASPTTGGLINGLAFNSNAVSINNAQHATAPSTSNFRGLPGLQTPQSTSKPPTLKPTSSGLDPIFLEKSDSLVRAEGQLKRQRIERELQNQLDQRRPGMDKIAGTAQDPSPLDVDAILRSSNALELHVSGLKSAQPASPASSFDTNDYYSSQVESEWSSPASASKTSDRAAGAITGDFEQPNEPNALSAVARYSSKHNASAHGSENRSAHGTFGQNFAVDEEEDDEYTPPDASAFDSFVVDSAATLMHGVPPGDDDNSDYEPGEITQESNIPIPYYQPQQATQPSPQVPVIRNHLTHIAAPQPNRVSPLAVAKRPSIELELVNGRPEVVRKQQHRIQSRASTASPVNTGGASLNNKKKRREKKRKRESEPSGRGKRKREKQHATQSSPIYQEPRIKDEPVSPPPFANISDIQPYTQRTHYPYNPAEIDLVSPRHVQTQAVYGNEPPRSSLRYEYAQPTSPAVVRIASPSTLRPVQRDNQDLRRVASLHSAHIQPSPADRTYSPAPHRTVSLSYADSRFQNPQAIVDLEAPRYQERQMQDNVRYVRVDRSQSPPRLQHYQDPYGRIQSPAIMPPPAAPPRKIVMDQYGNQYYAAEPGPAPAPMPTRASVAPVERRPAAEQGYDRVPSGVGTYAQTPALYEMAPPAVSRRQTETQGVQYVDGNGYRVRESNMQPLDQPRYTHAPTSPVYQPAPRYEQMPPPTLSNREPTSPLYAPPRSYSVRPEEIAPQPVTYAPRQASVAPVQYVRQDAPPPSARAMSVAPGYEQPAAAYSRAYSQVPQQIQYVDQYGRPVYSTNMQHVPRYQ